MDIEELRAVANEGTGLVPLTILTPFMPYDKGQVAGFPPEVALSYINSGTAELYKAKKADAKNPMIGMTGPAPGSHAASQVAHGQALLDRTTMYDGRPEITPRAQTAPPTIQEPGAVPQKAQIPEGWESWPGAKKRTVAADLSGKSYQELSIPDSEVIIRAAIAGEHAPPTSSDQNVGGAAHAG